MLLIHRLPQLEKEFKIELAQHEVINSIRLAISLSTLTALH